MHDAIIFDYSCVSTGTNLPAVPKGNSGLEVKMKVEIHSRDFPITRAMRAHIERRLGFALKAGYEHVKRVLVRLSDVNGPRGGNDKRCQLEVLLPGQTVVVKDTKADLYVAIDRAASRASRGVMRWLGRKRDVKRQDNPAEQRLLEHNAQAHFPILNEA